MVIAGYFASFWGTTVTFVYVGQLLYITRQLIIAANKSAINPTLMEKKRKVFENVLISQGLSPLNKTQEDV